LRVTVDSAQSGRNFGLIQLDTHPHPRHRLRTTVVEVRRVALAARDVFAAAEDAAWEAAAGTVDEGAEEVEDCGGVEEGLEGRQGVGVGG